MACFGEYGAGAGSACGAAEIATCGLRKVSLPFCSAGGVGSAAVESVASKPSTVPHTAARKRAPPPVLNIFISVGAGGKITR